MGLGVIAIGVLGALPFRHAPPPELTAAAIIESPATLGEGVSLQVPGQTAVAVYQPPELQPLPVEEEEVVADTVSHGAMVTISPPPRLADQYQPLFSADTPRQTGAGRVVAPGDSSTAAPKKLKQHTIHDGDTLELLAQRYLGDASRAQEILEANRAVLSDPAVLPIGVRIIIPRRTVAGTQPSVVGSEVQTRNLVPLPAIGFRRSR